MAANPDSRFCAPGAEGAESATALSVVGAGAAVLSASAGAAGGVAAAATALRVLPTLLVDGLTLVVGSSHPAEGRQRAPYESSTHQLERPTSRDATASQSSSQLVEGAVGSLLAHPWLLSPKGRD